MTGLIASNSFRLRLTLTIVACLLILSLVSLWQTVWAQGEFDVGDAPSSWNNFGPAPMTAYPWLPLGSANYPVVAFPPAPPSPDGYGFCHLGSPSYLGAAKSAEFDADVGGDSDSINNIIPPADIPDLDGFDDGVVFPASMPSCQPTTIQVQGFAGVPSFINVWADWNRDGDWNEGTVCACGDAEWAVQNWPVPPGPFLQQVPIVPCNPVADTDPVWYRVSLTDLPLPLSGDPEWTAGGTPISFTGFCFPDGETEDYYVQLEEPACDWTKEVSINDGQFVPADTGSFGVVLSDTVDISETLSCNFEFDWELVESWDPLVFTLVYSDTSHGLVDAYEDSLVWYGGYEFGGTPVTLTKSLQVLATDWIRTEVMEQVDFSPLGLHLDAPPVEFAEMVEGGDAPSSHNHPGLSMTAYPPGGPPGVLANYPVVWDWDGTLGPGPAGDYGFCHWPSSNPSLLGAFVTWELDADVPPDQDVVTNIDPLLDIPDQDSVSTPWPGDDGMQFPTALPSCGTAMVPIQGLNSSGGPLYLNVWADWTRDGDWDDTSLCACVVDEWAIKDYAVTAPGPFSVLIPVTPCHPGGDPTAPLWVRATLAEMPLVGLGTPWSWGGQPHPAFDPTGGPQGCFLYGETEDYYVEPQEPTCDWLKEVYINGEFAMDWEVPDHQVLGVAVSDTITISDAVRCDFFYDWELDESWDPAVLSLVSQDSSQGNVVEGTGSLEWSGGDPIKVAPGTWVTLTKTLHVAAPGWRETLIEETLEISPEGATEPTTRTVSLQELVEGGDAPSSHNHTASIMHTYNPAFGGVPANFPVVWDAIGALPPGPGGGAYAPGYYGFCHWANNSPSYLGPPAGPSKSYELDADLFPDQDGKTNIDPPVDTPNWDGHDDGVFAPPQVLPQCGPAIFHVQVNNNSGGILYLNGWADWNRDGDWEDGSVCYCGDDEWAVQDIAVGPGYHLLPVQVTPCHPGFVPGDTFDPFWMRFTLSPLILGSYGAPFTYGGFPFSAASQGCFEDGETEDYFMEPEFFDVCMWDKEVTIDGEGPYMPEEGPFTVSVSDTVLITDTLWCSFDYDWDLWEYWDGSALTLEDDDRTHGSEALDPGMPPEWLHWWGGPIVGNPPVQLWKWFHVDDFPNLPEPLVITETVDFSPQGVMPTWQRPIVLQPHSTYVPLVLKRY